MKVVIGMQWVRLESSCSLLKAEIDMFSKSVHIGCQTAAKYGDAGYNVAGGLLVSMTPGLSYYLCVHVVSA